MSNPALDKAYKQAQKKGPKAVKKFLKQHPKYANRLPGGSNDQSAPVDDVTAGTTQQLIDDAKVQKPGSVYGADVAAENDESAAQIKYQNPNVTNPLGTSNTTVNDDGTVSVDQSLSENQKAILETGEGLTQSGMNQAGQLLSGYQKFGYDSGNSGRERIEDAVYSRLTKNMDRDRGRELEAAKQSLHNRGIQFSDDPNSRYQQELGAINERYDSQRLDAMNQAVMTGGSEMQRDYSIQSGVHQQGMNDLSSLTNAGTGLMMPNFQAYQGPNYDVQDPSSYIYKAKDYKNIAHDQKMAETALAQENALAHKQLGIQAAAAAPQAPAPPPFP